MSDTETDSSRSQLVSVIVPAYNEAKTIESCLESLYRQNYPQLEIIVVDDASTDDTCAVLDSIGDGRIRRIRIPHSGAGAARNAGAAAAKGEILVFADADIEYDREYVAKLVEPILNGSAIATDHGNETVKQPNLIALCYGSVRGTSTGFSVVARAVLKSEFISAKGFDTDAGYFDDRTLTERLKVQAIVVPGTRCFHSSPDTFGEVFSQSRWVGRSYRKKYGGAKLALLRAFRLSLPLVAVFPAYGVVYLVGFCLAPVSHAVKERRLSMVLAYSVFQLVDAAGWSLGYIEGVLSRRTKVSR